MSEVQKDCELRLLSQQKIYSGRQQYFHMCLLRLLTILLFLLGAQAQGLTLNNSPMGIYSTSSQVRTQTIASGNSYSSGSSQGSTIEIVVPDNADVTVMDVPDGVNPSVFFPPGLIPNDVEIIVITSNASGSRKSQWGYSGLNPNSSFTSCPQNQYPSTPCQCSCDCIPGYLRTSTGLCVINTPYNGVCNSKYAYINSEGLCVCQYGYAFNSLYTCVPINGTIQCPLGGVIQANGSCVCIPPLALSNGVCFYCRQGFYWNGQTCIMTCPQNFVYDLNSRKCVCMNKFYEASPNLCLPCPNQGINVNGVCVNCPLYAQLVGNRCQCLPGTQQISGICVLICPYGSFYNQQTSKCVCIEHNRYVDQSNTCVPCPSGTQESGGVCVTCSAPNWLDLRTGTCYMCLSPSFIWNGVCIRCPNNAQWDSLARRCVCISGHEVIGGVCGQGQPCFSGVFIDGICVDCPNGRIINLQCECNPGYLMSNGVCVEVCSPPGIRSRSGKCIFCPLNSQWNPAVQRCTCSFGFSIDLFGSCNNQCPIGSYMTRYLVCSCISGYYPINNNVGTCAICPSNCRQCTSYGSCTQCLNPYVLAGGKCNAPITAVFCRAPLLPCNSSASGCCVCSVINCISCSTLSANVCVTCNTGYNVVNGQCVLTNTTQGCSPACQPGFYCLNNICVNPINNTFTIALVSSITSQISQSRFTISISPIVNYYKNTFPTSALLMQSASRGFVKISFKGLSDNQIPESYCMQQAVNLSLWDCTVNYRNQPIGVPYNMVMTAFNPQNITQVGYLLLTVNPVQAVSSINDATMLMRSPGNLATITSTSNQTTQAIVKIGTTGGLITIGRT